jgi:hypothetical protein
LCVIAARTVERKRKIGRHHVDDLAADGVGIHANFQRRFRDALPERPPAGGRRYATASPDPFVKTVGQGWGVGIDAQILGTRPGRIGDRTHFVSRSPPVPRARARRAGRPCFRSDATAAKSKAPRRLVAAVIEAYSIDSALRSILPRASI